MNSLLYTLSVVISTSLFNGYVTQPAARTVTGIVSDSLNNEPLIFASVTSLCNAANTMTDLDGRFSITIPDTCGILEISYTGYPSRRIDVAGKDFINVKMLPGLTLNAIEVVAYKIPMGNMDNTMSGGAMTAKQIRNMPTKNINAIAASTAGTSSANKGKVEVRGSRSNAIDYYLDGIRVSKGVQSGAVTNAPGVPDEFNAEDYDLIIENEFQDPDDAPLSTFSVDVDAASYSNMRRFIMSGQLPPKDAIRIEELINYFDYAYPQPAADKPIAVYSEVADCPWALGHKLVHIGIQGRTMDADSLPPSNLVFLIDVSGSMQCENKLPLVIASFKLLVEQLRKEDRVAIVVYAGSTGLVLPSTSGAEKATIIEAIERLTAGGSTAGAAGIKLAYNVAIENYIPGGNNRVVLATDGDFNVGVSSNAELVGLIEKKRESGVFLSVLGFGMGNYKDSKMQELADHGNGNHAYIDDISEAKKVFVHEFGGTLFTIAKDVKIQVEFNPELVGAYRLIGYENRILEAQDFNNDKKDAGEIGCNHSVTAIYEIIPVGAVMDLLKPVDELKYQKQQLRKSGSNSKELLTVKFRYKHPHENTSALIEHVVPDVDRSFDTASEDFMFSAAVASFGMLLRGSDFAGKATHEDVLAWASKSTGEDINGYRQQFVNIVRRVPVLPGITADR